MFVLRFWRKSGGSANPHQRSRRSHPYAPNQLGNSKPLFHFICHAIGWRTGASYDHVERMVFLMDKTVSDAALRNESPERVIPGHQRRGLCIAGKAAIRGKLQASNSKHQRNSNIQTSNSNPAFNVRLFVVWSFCPQRSLCGHSLAEALGDGFRAGAHVEFLVDVADVGVNGVVADVHRRRDFLVEKPLG